MSGATRRLVGAALLAGAVPLLSGCRGRFSHAVGPDTGRFVASKTGERYHRPDCGVARKIQSSQLLYYKTGDDAYADGFTPCKVCRPEQQARAPERSSRAVRPARSDPASSSLARRLPRF